MSEAYGEWLERNDHPLLNHVIVDRVFKHLRRWKDLKECRLVCKTWHERTIPISRSIMKIIIHGNESTSIHRIGNFVETFRSNSLGFPFSRFKLGSFCTTEGVGQEFLELCGNTITEIDFLQENVCVEDVSELLKSTPKLDTFTVPQLQSRSENGNTIKLFPDPNSKLRLKSLEKFYTFLDNPVKRNKCCPTFLEELITVAENISCLKLLDTIPCEDEGNVRRCNSEVMGIIEKLGREARIHELDILEVFPQKIVDVDLLREMTKKPEGLKLKKLQYVVYPGETEDSKDHTLLQLLSMFKKTLQDLCILGSICTSFIEFPRMSSLIYLNILVGSGRKFNFGFGNLKKIFPVLEVLDLLERTPDSEIDEFFPDSDPCTTMKTFQLVGDGIPFNTKTLNQMINIFPNLIDLKIPIREVGADGLRQIWLRMTQLKYLSLSGTVQTDESLDSVLTGISTLALQEIRDADVIHKLGEMTAEVERREMILKLRTQHSPMQHPSIANLSNLSSLTLELTGNGIDGNGGTSPLTDLSGYLGFYSMERLKHLTVRDCELTESCCEMLTMDMELQSALFRNEENKDIIPPVEY